MTRKTSLTRDEHRALGAALRRMNSDVHGLLVLLSRIDRKNSRAMLATRRMERSLSTVRCALDGLAVPLWPREKTQEALGVYYGNEPPSQEIAAVRDAVVDRCP